jgi:3-methyladenine DNA glycosylase AlkD
LTREDERSSCPLVQPEIASEFNAFTGFLAAARIDSIASMTLRQSLEALRNPGKAAILARFFKTGAGQYGEGDIFWGIMVPQVRKVVREHRNATMAELRKSVRSPVHEERLAALLVMVDQFQRGDARQQSRIYNFYLAHMRYINNWDLVDVTAEHIVGAYLAERDRSMLYTLASSPVLWERRIAIISTFHFIKRGQPEDTLRIAELLLYDRHDLMHKAVGWMLREVGKRCSASPLLAFLDRHAAVMPRTMLRYSIERLPEALRRKYLAAVNYR